MRHIRGQIARLGIPGQFRALELSLSRLGPEALRDLSRLLGEVEQMETRLNRAKRLLPGVIR
ncbi:MAG: hypothetical protein GY769_17610 [bacterium]|nr:hypothetical protein [bacterium]